MEENYIRIVSGKIDDNPSVALVDTLHLIHRCSNFVGEFVEIKRVFKN